MIMSWPFVGISYLRKKNSVPEIKYTKISYPMDLFKGFFNKIIIKIPIPENLIPNPPVNLKYYVLSFKSIYSFLMLLIYILIYTFFTYHYIQTSHANKQSDFGHENVTLCMFDSNHADFCSWTQNWLIFKTLNFNLVSPLMFCFCILVFYSFHQQMCPEFTFYYNWNRKCFFAS